MEKPPASPADGSRVARMQRQLVGWTRSEVLQEASQGSPLSVATPRTAPSTANRKPTFEPTNPSQSVAGSRTPCQATRWTAAWTSQNATVRDDPTRPTTVLSYLRIGCWLRLSRRSRALTCSVGVRTILAAQGPNSGSVRGQDLTPTDTTDDVYAYGRIVGSILSRGYPAAVAVRACSPLTTHPR
jgi:hypothetical protein